MALVEAIHRSWNGQGDLSKAMSLRQIVERGPPPDTSFVAGVNCLQPAWRGFNPRTLGVDEIVDRTLLDD